MEKHTSFGTLLTEYNFRVVIEIVKEVEISRIPVEKIGNPCVHHTYISEHSPDRIEITESSVVRVYIGRLVSIFE